MIYKENQSLNGLKSGDVLVMNNGSVHEALKDDGLYQCSFDCSLFRINYAEHYKCLSIGCHSGVNSFHFKQIEP